MEVYWNRNCSSPAIGHVYINATEAHRIHFLPYCISCKRANSLKRRIPFSALGDSKLRGWMHIQKVLQLHRLENYRKGLWRGQLSQVCWLCHAEGVALTSRLGSTECTKPPRNTENSLTLGCHHRSSSDAHLCKHLHIAFTRCTHWNQGPFVAEINFGGSEKPLITCNWWSMGMALNEIISSWETDKGKYF